MGSPCPKHGKLELATPGSQPGGWEPAPKTYSNILESFMNKLSIKVIQMIEVSIEDNCLHGRVLFIEDIVTYEGGND